MKKAEQKEETLKALNDEVNELMAFMESNNKTKEDQEELQ